MPVPLEKVNFLRFRPLELGAMIRGHIRICGKNLKPASPAKRLLRNCLSDPGIDELFLKRHAVATWIIYRKGSFFLKERIEDDALFQDRKMILETSGATYVGLIHDPESNPWLRKAFELPRPSH
jgi:hypothetical protein